jgi:hypothetical protein
LNVTREVIVYVAPASKLIVGGAVTHAPFVQNNGIEMYDDPSILIATLGAGGAVVTAGDGRISYTNSKSVKLIEVRLCTVYVAVVDEPAVVTVLVVADAVSVNSPTVHGNDDDGDVLGEGLGLADGDADAEVDGGATIGTCPIAVRDAASATLIDARANIKPAIPVTINVRGRI